MFEIAPLPDFVLKFRVAGEWIRARVVAAQSARASEKVGNTTHTHTKQREARCEEGSE